MAYNYLSDLKGDAENWMIKVPICRMWDSISIKDNTLLSMDMILSDKKGNLMHAVVRKHLVPRFKCLLTEGLVYTLRNVKVTTNIYPYRPVASNLRLLFLAITGVEALGEAEAVACIPKYGFQFVNQAALQSRADDVNTLSDIVGCLCGFGEIEVVGAGRRKRDIRVFTDYSVTSTVTLWGKLGELFDPTLYTLQDDSPYVIVVSSVIVKTYQGALTFATTNGSRVYVNRDVDYVTSVKERFLDLSPKVVAIEGPAASKLTPKEAMFINRMNVEVEGVTLKARITAINNKSGWYYVSCKSCVRNVVPRDEVEEGTGSTSLVLFNSTVERLLDISAKKLIKKMPPGDTSVPSKLQPLLGKELVFRLKLNKYNLVDGLQDYGVSAVYTPHGGAGAYLVEPLADVPESDNKRKRKLSPIIGDATGCSNGTT
ncbi:DUF223 domain-containing protein [Heracleum sosnowskyi]|uniref:DUF223 domain-containing protein n=1 Tax=Heracleum sosnowskyi TaxID=360622 RepID=A0AAD8HIT1_9APIA|nr:DUF223 domain-containing protein [Heracleum sosnowskyi]